MSFRQLVRGTWSMCKTRADTERLIGSSGTMYMLAHKNELSETVPSMICHCSGRFSALLLYVGQLFQTKILIAQLQYLQGNTCSTNVWLGEYHL